MFFVILLVSGAFAALSFRLFRSAWQVKGAEGWLALAFLWTPVGINMRGVGNVERILWHGNRSG